MLGLAARILNDKAKAEDAVQSAFAKIYKGLEGFENRADVKTWIYRIVVNEALMTLRKAKRLNEQSLDELLPVFDENECRVVPSAVTSDTAETALESQQSTEIVKSEIGNLPELYRVVLILRDIEEITTAEVATLLDMSEANVRVRLHRARAALKKRLEPLITRGAL